MEVRERGADRLKGVKRYYAHFKDAEMKHNRADRFLRGTIGNGHTEEEAITDYARAISEKVLVCGAMSDTERREIDVPRIVGGST